MAVTVELRVMELLNARLCHELISPVGAINNGIELLDEDDPEFIKEAMTLIGQSARKAGQRLQFYRFAYGTAGGSAARFDGRELANALLDGGKVSCSWAPEAISLDAPWQRLACNMLVLAAEVLPRGGAVTVRVLGAGTSGIEVAAEGEAINIAAELRGALEPGVGVDQLTSRTVHAYFSRRLAELLGATLTLPEAGGARAIFRAAA